MTTAFGLQHLDAAHVEGVSKPSDLVFSHPPFHNIVVWQRAEERPFGQEWFTDRSSTLHEG